MEEGEDAARPQKSMRLTEEVGISGVGKGVEEDAVKRGRTQLWCDLLPKAQNWRDRRALRDSLCVGDRRVEDAAIGLNDEVLQHTGSREMPRAEPQTEANLQDTSRAAR